MSNLAYRVTLRRASIQQQKEKKQNEQLYVCTILVTANILGGQLSEGSIDEHTDYKKSNNSCSDLPTKRGAHRGLIRF